MGQPLDEAQVRSVAKLARLDLSAEEVSLFAAQLGDVIEHVQSLAAVPTDTVEPLAHPLPLTDCLRDDDPTPPLGAEAALLNAPAREGEYFRVPTVLDSGA